MNLIAWAGYVEDGSTDPKVDWVSDFEKQTGCKVNVKIGNTSDEMVTLMRTGKYDGVSASGDATLRLVAGDDVEPVNTDLVPNYKDVFPALKDQPHNTVDGVNYGIPHGRGANLLMWNTDVVKPAPGLVGRGVRRAREREVQGQGHRVRQPDLHRGRRAVPEGDEAGARDRQRLRAGREAVRRRRGPAQGAARDDRRVLVGLHQGAGRVHGRRLRGGHHLAGDREPGRGRQELTADRCGASEGGGDGMVGHMDDLVQGQAPELHVQVDEPHRLPQGERRRWPSGSGRRRRTRSRAPRPRTRTTATRSTRTTRSTSTRSPTGRRRRKDCGDDRGADCKDYSEWVKAWTEIKG